MLCRPKLLKSTLLHTLNILGQTSSLFIHMGKSFYGIQEGAYSMMPCVDDNTDKELGKFSLAEDLASLVEESSKVAEKKPKSRMELKRSLEYRVKKRVKEQYVNGKFQDLMGKVISNPETLQDAYNCLRLNSNVGVDLNYDNSFSDLAEGLSLGTFDITANTFALSTRRGVGKEVLVLPNLKLKVLQEAIRITLEIVYRPHFSKISHGCRSGRGHSTALKYICKGISNPDWWFTLQVTKKLDAAVLNKLISEMEDKIEDPKLYAMIWSMFDAQVLNFEFGGFPKGHGLPQEGVLSSILMNIYFDLFDREFYKLSMKYEAISGGRSCDDQDKSCSRLRSWFRRQLKGQDPKCIVDGSPGLKVYSCRVMDEIFFAVSGSRESAINLKTEIQSYLKDSLLLDVNDQTDILPCDGPDHIRFLGASLRRSVRESPAVKAVHKLKKKVELFALQRQEAWNYGTVRIGKKWLGHGLKKVKESEIKHLANDSLLNSVSCFRKPGMETDHWYKYLIKIWMEVVGAKNAASEEIVLSKFVAEPSLPPELRDSYYEFLNQVDKYISSETASTIQLLTNYDISKQPDIKKTEIIAPICAIKKRLQRYGLVTSSGCPCPANLLILQDTAEIIDWFSGIVRRWLRWYKDCVNFNEVKLLISDEVRKSCIRTLAVKYRIHESVIEKRFDQELSSLPLTEEIENKMTNEASDVETFDNDESLMYGIFHSGLCSLSLARLVTQSRPCNCFVIGCSYAAPSVYTLHVMERQKFPSWKTGFSTCIHPSLNKRRIGLCKQHLRDLYLGHISLQSIDFGSWK